MGTSKYTRRSTNGASMQHISDHAHNIVRYAEPISLSSYRGIQSKICYNPHALHWTSLAIRQLWALVLHNIHNRSIFLSLWNGYICHRMNMWSLRKYIIETSNVLYTQCHFYQDYNNIVTNKVLVPKPRLWAHINLVINNRYSHRTTDNLITAMKQLCRQRLHKKGCACK